MSQLKASLIVQGHLGLTQFVDGTNNNCVTDPKKINQSGRIMS